ncbi:MAG TPA: nucleotidyltransferase family protein [Polyangiaceae bacterium]|jgi:molybdenum cofactor cytidylyltransferase
MPTFDSSNIAAVVLAAGSSTRMGNNKLLLDLGGESVVRRAVRAAIEAALDPVIVVMGHERERVQTELHGLRYTPIWNPRHAEGVATSLKAGVTAASDAAALVVVLADMPFVTPAMIGAVAGRYRAARARLVVSRYGAVDAPPICYDRELFGELLREPGERCAKRVVRRHIDQAAIVTWPESALRDIDIAADYELARTEIAGRW